MQKTSEIAQKNHDESIKELKNQNRMLENQVAQLADTLSKRQPGKLPGQSTPSQDHTRESACAIVLRRVETPGVENEIEKKESGKEKVTDSLPFSPTLPFPHRMQKTKVDQQFGKFLAMVKNLEVTIPFTDLISQIPMYAKYLKELITKKRNIGGVERVALIEECSAMLQNKSPPKLKDPGSFSIPCHIGDLFIDKALCDLGVSVSVIPLSIYKKLNMGELKCTTITLQMADHSIKYPLGVLEDVPVRVGIFYIPVDFVVLDIAEDNQIPIILGRPFLHTAGETIDVKKGKLTLTVGDDKVTFNLSHEMKSPMQEVPCSLIASNAKLPHSYSRNSSNNALGLKGFAGDDDPGDAVDISPTVGARCSVLDGTKFKANDQCLKLYTEGAYIGKLETIYLSDPPIDA
ncbi:uncharacterized protein [Spinacia oleracea]|uniref:Aspartic peptidase DDI1-type domain-containing protein n=1 Tax=Spinacia oleracea TaxID=3562 RepID=A0ABM3RR04_SPIOL|nr:uncharacterized protein LOC130471739 [Spinacia oleracea]